jgi:hypothetical protein
MHDVERLFRKVSRQRIALLDEDRRRQVLSPHVARPEADPHEGGKIYPAAAVNVEKLALTHWQEFRTARLVDQAPVLLQTRKVPFGQR